MQRGAPEAAALEVVGASIEGGAFGVGASGAEADQPPTHAGELACARIAGLANNGLNCAGCDVVAGRQRLVCCRCRVELFCNCLFVSRSIVASAHSEDMPLCMASALRISPRP